MTSRFASLAFLLALALPAFAADWLHWRGPEQNGTAREPGLPDGFELDKVGENNLLWKIPLGGRSAPLAMAGKLFVITGYDPSKATEGERVVCVDAETGKIEWEFKFNVFHTDIVTSRLGWSTLTADAKEKTVFAHTSGGHLYCLDAATGKPKWQRQLTEEFGRVTGYGGRVPSPIFDAETGLVICGFVNGSWGDQGRGGSRFAAFDGKTGEVAWWQEVTSVARPVKNTYFSNPVIANIDGQRLLLSGAADGGIHALKVRTGELAWSYIFSAMVINPAPVVDGNLVYSCHGEPNPEGGVEGRIVCLDAGQIDPKTKKPKVVWEFKKGRRFGLSSPSLADGKLYVPEDGGALFCFDAKDGKLLWEHKYGSTARGAPLVAGGKLYIFEVNAKLTVLQKHTNKKPLEDDVTEYTFKSRSGNGFPETNGTPIAVNGRLYFHTIEDLYCIGKKDYKPTANEPKPGPKETAYDPKGQVVAVSVYPADVALKSGATQQFQIRYLDANGRALPMPEGAKPEWILALPPKTPTGAQPPALAGTVADGLFQAGPLPSQQGYVDVKFGELKARARVRVVPQIPYKQDFEKAPLGGVPSGWINAQGKFEIVEMEIAGKKEKVLSKIANDPRPPIARANAYITGPESKDYTVQADLMGGEVGGKLPDMGVVCQRALFVLDGKADGTDGKRTVRIISWEARNRINKAVDFDWKKETWYTLKFTSVVEGGKGTLKGKVWERGQPEPEAWTIEAVDPNPNTEGAAALYGYVSNATGGLPGSPIYYDNVAITPNKK